MITIKPCKWTLHHEKIGGKNNSIKVAVATPYIERVGQITGPDKYAIRTGGSTCMNKKGEWEYEPMPSNRNDAFMERCRFDSFSEAIKVYKQGLN